jgi:signal transduction histidine kinase
VQNPHDELGGLAVVMNELLTRLDNGIAQQRQFVADASHELRTPVAILRAETDVTLAQSSRSERQYREAFGVMGLATDRLSRIVEDLFLLARADAGQRMLELRVLYLDELLADVVRSYTQVAAQRAVVVAFGEPPTHEEGPTCRGDVNLLDRLFLNLLDNAVKHSPAGGRVQVTLHTEGGWHVIDVRDQGSGIPPAAQPLVFDRFFRVETTRARDDSPPPPRGSALPETRDATLIRSSGAGLGLAITRWIAEAHGGSVTLHASDSQGSCFRVMLPTQ